MKMLVTALLLLSLAFPAAQTGCAGKLPHRRSKPPRQTAPQETRLPESHGDGLKMSELDVPIIPRLGLGFPPKKTDHYYLFPKCGFGLVRLNVRWQLREPTRGSYQWAGLDARVRALQDLGMDVMLTLESSSEWGTKPTKYTAANQVPARMSDWTEFVTRLVEHYDGDGVQDMKGLKRPVKYYQFANEWPAKRNRSGGWTGTIDELIEYLNASYDAVKAADPKAPVILGGIASIGLDVMVLAAGEGHYTARPSYSPEAKQILTVDSVKRDPRSRQMVDDRERVLRNARYDMVDLHLYGPVEYNQYRIARIRESVGDRVPLVCTEGGGPNLAYDPDITPDEHFLTVFDWNLDGFARDMKFMTWLSFFAQEYGPKSSVTWGNSQLQLIGTDRKPNGGFWAYHLLARQLEGMTKVEKPGDGLYIIHRAGKPDVFVGWKTPAHSTYRLPQGFAAEKMVTVTNAREGLYQVQAAPSDGVIPLGPLPTVVGVDVP